MTQHDHLTDPQPGGVVRSTPWTRTIVSRDGDKIFYRMNGARKIHDCTLYQWRESMRLCGYRVSES